MTEEPSFAGEEYEEPFFDGEAYANEPEPSTLGQLSFGLGAVVALVVGLCAVAVLVYIGFTDYVGPALSRFVKGWTLFGEEV
ncbi:MAG TPA: hypothetical protein VJ653_02265 [Acidimicrobiales bacterium]|nr:hypothetical protein [Acidimicrobiales bacterium]